MKFVTWGLVGAAVVYVVYLVSPSHKTCGFFDWLMQKCG